MDLDRLGMFLQVVDTGTVRGAAARVHLTQPAVSKNLRLLERQLGAALFRRQGRTLALTAAGRALVPRARALLGQARAAAREVSRSAERDYFDVRLGAIDSVATFVLPRALAGLRRRFPDLVVRVTTGRTSALLDRLHTGDLDLGIVAFEGAPPEVRCRRAADYALQFYGRRDRFPALARITTMQGLAAFPIVEIEPPPGAAGASVPESMSYARASNIATVKAMILAGFGVGDLLAFCLAPGERRQLVAAAIPHSAACALYLCGAGGWTGRTERVIEAELTRLLGLAVRDAARVRLRSGRGGRRRAAVSRLKP